MSGGTTGSYVIIDIRISADEYLKMYQGLARDVVTYARDGRKVRFPAKILQRFVMRDGVYGSFAIQFDEQHKFRSIERL